MLLENARFTGHGLGFVSRVASIPSVGLTGGIGAGKSTAASVFRQHGAYVIDADHISRQMTGVGGAAIGAIAQVFGPEMIAADGAMDRVKMRALVFSNPLAKQSLEAIVHPLIYQETERQGLLARQNKARCVVFDLPLLVESPRWRKRLDHVVVVDCDPEVQISRVEARSHLGRSEVQSIIAQQAPRPLRLRAADTVIDNSRPDLEALKQNVLIFLNFFAPALETSNSGVASCIG